MHSYGKQIIYFARCSLILFFCGLLVFSYLVVVGFFFFCWRVFLCLFACWFLMQRVTHFCRVGFCPCCHISISPPEQVPGRVNSHSQPSALRCWRSAAGVQEDTPVWAGHVALPHSWASAPLWPVSSYVAPWRAQRWITLPWIGSPYLCASSLIGKHITS